MAGKIKDLTNQKFGRLTVRELSYVDKKRGAVWLCDCECGNTKEVLSVHLVRGDTKSCGCLLKDVSKNLHKTHGLSNTRIHNIWMHTRRKCTNPNDKRYKDYGERGIKVCDEWMNDFISFYNWSMQNGYQDDLTLDRIDVDGNYEPNNCRWVDNDVQSHNKRLDKLYTYNGKTLSVRDWCKEIGFYWSLFGKDPRLPKEELSE